MDTSVPLPSFTVTGDLFNIIGAEASELATPALTGTITFTSNVPTNEFVTWGGDLYRVGPVTARVTGSGVTYNGAPLLLLANDAGLSVDGLQWHAQIEVKPDPGSGITRTMKDFWFNAPADGGTADLATVAPVTAATPVGITKGDPGAPVDDVQVTVDGDLQFYVNGVAIGNPVPLPGGGGGSFNLPAGIHAATSKTTPVDADELALVDSAASNGLKKLTIANLKTLIQGLVDAGVSSVVAGAPSALNTLDELAAAFGDDANFAATMTTALAGKQPLDATLTALAALSTTANQLIYATGSDTFATTAITAAGRALLDDADAAAQRATLALGSVDNTADTAKPVSTAQQAALDLKAPLASPTFTGTVSGVTKAMVGLGSVDNTADTGKPVSTAQAAADAATLSSANASAASGDTSTLATATGRAVAFSIAGLG